MKMWVKSLSVGTMIVGLATAPVSADMTQKAENIVGPEKVDNSCSTCHALETEAWHNTRHYATYKDRHRSPEAKKILAALGVKSMKRGEGNQCIKCHYTSVASSKGPRPKWGVSCESCHNAGKEWVATHYKPGGDASADNLKWGTGKSEDPAKRKARLDAAKAKGMLHSKMLYHIAKNCYSCHTVPNEDVVNKGGHVAGSDFDLVAWSQGEIRHNFASSAGAPDAPKNRPATAEQKRRMYIVGAMVDLEVSLRNLSNVKEKGGAFHKAMVQRVNDGKAKIDAILKATDIPEIKAVIAGVPAKADEATAVDGALADKLAEASQAFATKYDGSTLAAVDGLIPTAVVGKAHKE